MVEFALLASALVLLVAGLLDVSRYIATRTSLRTAIDEVARAAMVDTALNGCAAPEAHALSKVTMLDPAALSVCVTRATASITVTAEYTFSFVIPIFGTGPQALRATVVTPVV